MTNLFEPPPVYELPLSKGGDLSVDFLNNGVGVTVTLIIDTEPAITKLAAVSTFHAAVKIESTVTDGIAKNTPWRLIVSSPTSPTTETVAANGKVKRFDG
jgi:hypothetical protein